ncbi:MAG TPA: hypothetical protein VH414_00670 [Lichenihabitans sp.]|jgi:hypothetical protein|nr:hypothetical protein [Lichenihabitans sp.]
MHIAARTNRYDAVASEFTRSRARAYRAAAVDPAGAAASSPYGTLAVVPRQTINEAATEGRTAPVLSLSSNLAVLDINALLESGAARLSTSPRPTVASSRPTPADADTSGSIDGLLSRMLAID